MKTPGSRIALLGALVCLAGGTAFAQSDTSSSSGSSSYPSQSGQSASSDVGSGAQSSTTGQVSQVNGVIQGVNASKHTIELIVPSGQSTSISQVGNVTELRREQDMVSLNVPVSQSAVVQRDGQSASFAQLRMGDSIRASFDPSSRSITKIQAQSLSATSQQNCGPGSSAMQNPTTPSK